MFPPCTFAGHAKPGDRRFCRLKQPAKLVSLSTCLACPHAESTDGELVPICTQQPQSLACIHRGGKVSTVGCSSCGGTVQIPVFACSLHEDCTIERDAGGGTKCCKTCRDRVEPKANIEPLTGPANLVWQVYPRIKTADIWREQQRIVRKSLHRFDGRKICVVQVDDLTDDSEVMPDGWDDFIVVVNSPTQWELPGWRAGMERLIKVGATGFTVRLHSKGVVRGVQEQHMERWWQLGYESLLNVDAVRKSLESHLVTGEFRLNNWIQNFGTKWCYAGSFYAFRNSVLSGKWQPTSRVAETHYVEAWPALIADGRAGCLRFDGVSDPYQKKNWRAVPSTKTVKDQRKVSGNSVKIQRPAKAIQSDEITVREPVKIVDAKPQRVISGQSPQVAIVIAGRNNRDYLREAIESALTQTIPCEVVYADDCSYDDSVYMASQYEARGLKVLPSPVHRGVCDARNRGSAATTAPYLMNLDSDDALTADYAEKSLAAMQFDTPFAYSVSNLVGMGSGFTPCPGWDQSDVWKTNHVNTSALYARWAFDLAGGWIETKSAWDWDLAMRAMRFGTPRKSGAILLYRRHTTSWSQSHDIIPRMHEYRLRNSLLSVASIVRGNDLKKFWPWMSAVVQAARQVDVRRELILMDDQSDLPIASEAAKYAAHFEAVRIIKGSDEGRLRAECAGNLVWIAEFGKLPHLQECRRCVEALSLPQSPPLTAKTDTTKIVRRIRP